MRTSERLSFDALLAALGVETQPMPFTKHHAQSRRGRTYGGGSRAYSGPRDAAHRAARPTLTPRLVRALNIAYRKPKTEPKPAA